MYGQVDGEIQKYSQKININQKQLETFNNMCANDPISLQAAKEDKRDGIDKYRDFTGNIKNKVFSLVLTKTQNPRTHQVCRFNPPPPWWNEKCTETVNERKQALSCFKNYPTMESYNYYITMKKYCNKIVKKQKRLG